MADAAPLQGPFTPVATGGFFAPDLGLGNQLANFRQAYPE